MTSSLQKFVFASCILFLLSHSTLAHSSKVTQIKIVSSWVGLGTPAHNELTITREAGNYYSGSKKVDAFFKKVVFWRFNSSDPTHLWNDKSAAWDCTYQGKCVGAIVSADGALVDKVSHKRHKKHKRFFLIT